VSFVEHALRNPDGGAIGVIAATRTTHAHGNIMIRGIVDSAIPGIDPSWGSSSPERRLGNILNAGRGCMDFKYGGSDNTRRHRFLYQTFGDRTLETWTEQPDQLPEIPTPIEIGPDFILIPYDVEGAVITALQETRNGVRPVGRGTVEDGVAQLQIAAEPLDGVELLYSASMESRVSTHLAPAVADVR